MFALFERALNVIRRRFARLGRSEPLDMAEIHQLQLQGLSWREIAARLPGKPPHNTVFVAYQKWERTHPKPARAAATPPQAVPLPVVSAEPPRSPVKPLDDFETALGSLRQPGAAARPPEPVREASAPDPEPVEPEADLSGVYGLDSVPPDTRAFFLVNGSANADLAHHMGQPAVGITEWRREHWRIPRFDNAVKLWVVINIDEDNSRFLRTLASDERMRAVCLIAPVRRGNVQAVCKSRLLARREEGHGYRDKYHFENVQGFVRLPTDARELAKMLPLPEKPEPEEPWSSPLEHREPWRIPQMPR